MSQWEGHGIRQASPYDNPQAQDLDPSTLPEVRPGLSTLPEVMPGLSTLPEVMPGLATLPEVMPGLSPEVMPDDRLPEVTAKVDPATTP